jgi:hypothetical protein
MKRKQLINKLLLPASVISWLPFVSRGEEQGAWGWGKTMEAGSWRVGPGVGDLRRSEADE